MKHFLLSKLFFHLPTVNISQHFIFCITCMLVSLKYINQCHVTSFNHVILLLVGNAIKNIAEFNFFTFSTSSENTESHFNSVTLTYTLNISYILHTLINKFQATLLLFFIHVSTNTTPPLPFTRFFRCLCLVLHPSFILPFICSLVSLAPVYLASLFS